MRRILALGVAALTLFAGLSACTVGGTNESGGGGGAGAKKEITFLVFETPNLTPQIWDAAIKRVTDKYPAISVKKLVSPNPGGAGVTQYAKQLLTSGQLPDVMVAVSPGGFAEGGNLYAWTPDDLKDFACPTCGAINGKVYQLPTNTQTIPVVYYNKDLSAKAGITAPPRTYAELLADAAKLKGAAQPFVVGQGHDSLGPTWAGILATEVYAKNPTWMRDRRAGKVKFASPEFIAAARKLADLASKGYINKRDVSRDYAATQQAFLDGKGAMYAMGNWFAAAADKLLISAFKLFDYVQVITKGGPGEGTTATIAFTILQVGFTANRQGYASAMAVVMLVIIAVASAVALKLLQRREVQL